VKIELDQEHRRRRRELLLIMIIAVLIVGITYLEIHLPQMRYQVPFGSNLLFFSIININMILLLLLIFLVGRNLIKLVFERKRRVLGARLKTKLVAAFVSLSLVPSILLFVTAVIFVTHSVENWFSVQVESSLQGSLEVAQTYYRDVAKNSIRHSRELSTRLPGLSDKALIEAVLEHKRNEYSLGSVTIFSPEGAVVTEVTNPELQYRLGDPPRELIDDVLTGKDVSRTTTVLGGGEIIWGASPLLKDEKVIGGVASGYYIPENLAAKMQKISEGFVDYKQAQILKKPITTNYIVILLMIPS
jgi:two-component system nitrogen regulation sensor histidine kinase NtrY